MPSLVIFDTRKNIISQLPRKRGLFLICVFHFDLDSLFRSIIDKMFMNRKRIFCGVQSILFCKDGRKVDMNFTRIVTTISLYKNLPTSVCL